MRSLTSAAATVAVLCGVMLSPAPAAASTPPLEYSADGITWQSTPVPLFAPDSRPVPGSVETSVTYVRSNRPVDASLAIFVDHAASPSTALLEATTISGADASEQRLSSLDRCLPLQSARIAPGQTLPVTVSMRVAPSMTGAQLTSLQVTMTALMSDSLVTPQPSGCDDETTAVDAALAETGMNTAQPWLLLGIGVSAAGGGALLARRRNREDAV